jgi:hypothetical protein
VAVVGRDFFRGPLKRVAAIVQGERLQDFRQGICLVADRARAWRERATARAAAIERNVLQFFLARALLDEAFAVAMGTAFRRFDCRAT